MKAFTAISILLLIQISSSFGQKTAPYEIFIVGVKSGDSVSVSLLQNQFRVECINSSYRVASFSFAFGDGNCVGGHGMYQATKCIGDTLNNIAREVLKHCKKGMPIYITDVKAVSRSGRTYYPKEIWFRIKK